MDGKFNHQTVHKINHINKYLIDPVFLKIIAIEALNIAVWMIKVSNHV